ncbi:hypothetical protein [Photobacterium phosphoreum]|uniref:hypothetical protein n=2 Tax=Photobacterium phosphoreum TaxID=659 RepID=UPI000A751D99|nr:hypothetical protein [Photobacterium phosphoreum]
MITVAELMLKFRDTYRQDSATSETALIRFLSNVDLLVIDERYTLEKPTGVITNLQSDELITTLGRAAVDRIMEDGKWVTFNWSSFRINKGTQPA